MLCTLRSRLPVERWWAGFDIASQATAVRLRIGVALQSSALDPKQTGRELLDLQGRYYGMTKTDRFRRVNELTIVSSDGAATIGPVAVLGVFVVGFGLSLLALRGRVSRR